MATKNRCAPSPTRLPTFAGLNSRPIQVSLDGLKTNSRWSEFGELATLFFLQAMAVGMWLVPLGPVLDAHGLAHLRPYAFATNAVAAFVSPLIFGAMADRHASPTRVLRGLTLASAAGMALAGFAVRQGWSPGAVLAVIQAYALCAVPTGSIASAIVFSRLQNSQRQFGPIRATGTFGWMVGCWVVSGLGADTSVRAFYAGSFAWIAVAAFTLLLPAVPPPPSPARTTFRERMGWDALVLFKNHDHRVVFITIALFSIPLAAFYPFTPQHLRALGFDRTAAWMSVGQITEIFAMFALGGLFARWRLKWIFGAGLALGVIRFALSALDTKTGLLAGITLHGLSFTLFFITAQIYLQERIDPQWRARAQALVSLMYSGVGSLLGYLGSGFWLAANSRSGPTHWTTFWGGLAFTMALAMAYFFVSYHGKSSGLKRPAAS